MTINPKIEPTSRGKAIPRPVLHKALSHPTRYRIMMVLGEREASPKELSEELEEDFLRVAEHVRQLRDWDLIELVDTDRRRGGKQHFYRARTLPLLGTDEWSELPPYARKTISGPIIEEIGREISESMAADLFDSTPNRVLIRKPLWLDEEGEKEVDDSAVRHLRACELAEARSSARALEKGTTRRRSVMALLAFLIAPRRHD
jgi:DNA-binding transcriptional ArsR family regulator